MGFMDRDSTDSFQGGLCKMGCGFFGNQSFEGMCSKCFKEHIKRKQQSPQPQPSGQNSSESDTKDQNVGTETPVAVAASNSTCGASKLEKSESDKNAIQVDNSIVSDDVENISIITSNEDENKKTDEASSSSSTSCGPKIDSSPEKPKKRNRCFTCKKKVGLTGFDCRCGGVYCGLHRYSNEHDCTFNYKADGQAQLASANPLVIGEKIKKI